ncbi:hypothetical protein ASD40_15835 [Paenibacillus sp. Root444D2]|nr:hypothetical protein ASD40_15835 [Paenibacillus sp. Root444D2]
MNLATKELRSFINKCKTEPATRVAPFILSPLLFSRLLKITASDPSALIFIKAFIQLLLHIQYLDHEHRWLNHSQYQRNDWDQR